MAHYTEWVLAAMFERGMHYLLDGLAVALDTPGGGADHAP